MYSNRCWSSNVIPKNYRVPEFDPCEFIKAKGNESFKIDFEFDYEKCKRHTKQINNFYMD